MVNTPCTYRVLPRISPFKTNPTNKPPSRTMEDDTRPKPPYVSPSPLASTTPHPNSDTLLKTPCLRLTAASPVRISLSPVGQVPIRNPTAIETSRLPHAPLAQAGRKQTNEPSKQACMYVHMYIHSLPVPARCVKKPAPLVPDGSALMRRPSLEGPTSQLRHRNPRLSAIEAARFAPTFTLYQACGR
jgi:hypothetical protein